MSTIRFFPALLVFGLLAVAPAPAQTTGTITGTVTDASAAVIPGVKVVAASKTTGERRETSTNQTGQYAIPFLTPGDYEVQFSINGFTSMTRTATLAVTERIAVDAVMQPAGVS